MFLKKYKSLMLPIAIILGVGFCKWISVFIHLVPVLIFFVLFFAYSGLHFRRLRITKLNVLLLFLHLFISIVSYTICYLIFKPIVAQGVLVGVICPVAAASSAVVTALGGNKEICIVHTLLDNFLISIAAPIMFSIAETSSDMSFIMSVLTLLGKLFPIVIFPLVAVVVLRRFTPRFAYKLRNYDWLSILFWSLALMINMAATGYSVLNMGGVYLNEIIIMVVLALFMCVFQFGLGRVLGNKVGEKVVVAQAIGQKNTGLGIWMAYTYFSNPLTTMYAAAYAVFQNLFNSLQMYIHDKKMQKTSL
ncbi:MAG: hypothetical protein IJ180_08390 [Bacteroidales bacterium]|nr:hypothetical protein [Bacteroidales bacterium]